MASEPSKKNAPSAKKSHLWRWIAAVVAVIIVAGGGYAWYVYSTAKSTVDHTYIPRKSKDKKKPAKKVAESAPDPVSFLLMATNGESFGRTDAKGSSDTNVLVTINPKTKTTTMTSIPRSELVELADEGTMAPMSQAYQQGGANDAADTTAHLLNVPVQQYAIFNMAGIASIVDAVGGIDVDVASDFTAGGKSFTAGKMHMDGQTALVYAHGTNNSANHTDVQRQVIKAILKAAPSVDTLTHFKEIMTSVKDNFRSSMTLDDMVTLYQKYLPAAKTMKDETLTGTSVTIDGTQYNVSSTDALQKISDEVRQNMNLDSATLNNAETKLNEANAQFDFTATTGTGYTLTTK